MVVTTLNRTAPETTAPAPERTRTSPVGSYVDRDGARLTPSRVGSYASTAPTVVGSYTDRGTARTNRRRGSYTDSER